MTSTDKSLTDCYWFLQNQCSKGDSCEFRHSKSALMNQATCTFWGEGKCSNKNCKLRHPSKIQQVCFYLVNGGCMKGSSCPYSHDLTLKLQTLTPDLEIIKKKQEEEIKKITRAKIGRRKKIGRITSN